MKKLLLLMMLFTGIINAQIVNIPDANFKAKLLAADVTNQIAYGNGGYLKIDANNDGDIQESEANVVDSLNVEFSNISNLIGISNFINLKKLACENNQITSINLTSNTFLKYVYCDYNLITSLQVNNLNNLTRLYCSNNQLSTINLFGLSNLNSLNLSHNQLTNFDASQLSNLKDINIEANNISTLNINGLTNIELLQFSFNPISVIDTSALVNLQNLYANNTQIEELNLNNSQDLSYIAVNENSSLKTILIKNNSNLSDILLYDCPNLEFICCDESKISFVQGLLDAQGYVNCNVNSYCTFTPGGNYNTITGTIKFDANNNACDALDLPQPNIRVNINDGNNQGAAFTNNAGNYTFYTQAGSYDLNLNVENPNWFTATPATGTIPFADNNNNTTTQDFCITPNGIHNDLEVVISPITPARPGFDAVYKITYRNKGNQILSGDVFLVYNNSLLDYLSSSVPLSSPSGNANIWWNYSNISPFETRVITVTFHVHSPTDPEPANIGNLLLFNTFIPIINDENQSDNVFTLAQIIVGSYDPNDITCLEGENVAPAEIGNYLHYAINFENLGTFYAENVVVKTIIDESKYDVSSLQLLNTSHPVYAKITGNVAEFIFKNINLAEAQGNPPVGGHGDILFKIRSKSDLIANDFVDKTASIYFDYNAPIDTNLATTTFTTLSNSVFNLDASISVSPNPTNSIVNINCNSKIQSVELYDAMGRILLTNVVNAVDTKLNISSKANGIYFVKIATEKGSKVEKVVKE